MMEDRPLLTVEEMAATLHVPVSWLYRHTSKGDIPFIKLGHYVRFDRDAVLTHFQTQQAPGQKAQGPI